MKQTIVAIIAGLLAFSFAESSEAGAPTCHAHSTGPYCRYEGHVSSVYINDGNIILLYFDTAMESSAPASVGISGVSQYSAAAYRLDDNPEYAKLLYASMLTAQARKATITVQMRNTLHGYLVIDRIWVSE